MTDPTPDAPDTPASNSSSSSPSDDFAELAEGENPGIVREFIDFLRHTRKWWLTPIIVVMLLVGLLVLLGSTGAAPFIYTLF